MIKKLSLILGWGLIMYLGFFLLWLVLMMGCLSYEERTGVESCGGDMMTEIVRTIYAPVIRLIAGLF